MAFYLKSTAYTRMFKMIDSADHISKKTGLTCTVNLSKAGAAFGAAGGAVAEVANGWYKVSLNTTDTNTSGDLAFYITATGADDTDFVDQVVDPTAANLGVNVVNWNNTVVATPATAGIPDVNAKQIGGTSQTGLDIAANYTAARATKLDNLDAAVTTRMATYTQPTGFLAATFPSGTIANTTNITTAAGCSLSATGSVAMTEDYPAKGATGTLNQLLYLAIQSLHEFAISGTTRTAKKLDGSTTAATFTLDSATVPTSTTRAT